ncbi:MAG TPA: tetratricopeptide repeat protein [Rectinemataceae bacterium]|nr:tetratricopeptide repeat protein [Rectinemataceae bacterium]
MEGAVVQDNVGRPDGFAGLWQGLSVRRLAFAIAGMLLATSLGISAQDASQGPDSASVQVAVSPTGAAVVGAPSSVLAEGEMLFRQNRPGDAIPRLEQAVQDPGVDENAWIWLAICYQQLNRYDDAASTLRKGLQKSVSHKALFWFDLGNLFLVQGKASFAKDMYDSAIGADSAMANAFLNRANAAMLLNDYSSAKDDYSHYLVLDPASSQKASIQALLELLGKTVADEAQKKAQAEAAKLAAETARKSLLDEVSASLKASAEDTTNLAAGSGQVQSYGDELPPSD